MYISYLYVIQPNPKNVPQNQINKIVFHFYSPIFYATMPLMLYIQSTTKKPHACEFAISRTTYIRAYNTGSRVLIIRWCTLIEQVT